MLSRLQAGPGRAGRHDCPPTDRALFVFLFFLCDLSRNGRRTSPHVQPRRRIDATLAHLLMHAYRLVGLSFITVLVLAQPGINVTVLLAGRSIAAPNVVRRVFVRRNIIVAM